MPYRKAMIEKSSAHEIQFEALNKIAQHDAEIKILGERMLSFDSHLRDVNRKLENIASSLSSFVARPQFEINNVISLVKDVAFLVGIGVAAIVYVAGNYSDNNITVLTERQQNLIKQYDHRLDALETRLTNIENSRWTKEQRNTWCKANKTNFPNVVCD